MQLAAFLCSSLCQISSDKSVALAQSASTCTRAIAGQYIVTLSKEYVKGQTATTATTAAASDLTSADVGVAATWAANFLVRSSRSGGGRLLADEDFSVLRTFSSALVGATVRVTDPVLASILADSAVELVEVDCGVSLDEPAAEKSRHDTAFSTMTAQAIPGSQPGAWWGLDHIDLVGHDGEYSYGAATGDGVRVCANSTGAKPSGAQPNAATHFRSLWTDVLDTGIRISHSGFRRAGSGWLVGWQQCGLATRRVGRCKLQRPRHALCLNSCGEYLRRGQGCHRGLGASSRLRDGLWLD